MPQKRTAKPLPLNQIQIAIRLPPGILAAAKKRAAADRRTLTSYIELLLARDLGMIETAPAGRPVIKRPDAVWLHRAEPNPAKGLTPIAKAETSHTTNHGCILRSVHSGRDWLQLVAGYEKVVLDKRSPPVRHVRP